jgi:hypothetical protein
MTLEMVAPSRSQARILFDNLARAVRDTEGVKVYPGYRRVHVGDLVVKVGSKR